MNLRNALLGTTAMLGAAALVVPSTASAFEVNIRGFFNFSTVMGDIDDALVGNRVDDYDFVTDSEIHIEGVNVDDETGIRYGMLVEFETDPQSGENIDESWIFVNGGFGGFRLGNEDGAVDNSKIGAYNIAAGTGGIDGQGVVGSVQFAPINSSDSTKIRYDSPSIAGFTIHGSLTPNFNTQGNNVALEDGIGDAYQNWIETALVYTNSFGGLDVQAGGTFSTNSGNDGFDDYQGYNLGATLGFSGFRVSGSYWQDMDAPDGTGPNGRGSGDRTGITAGAAATLGPADLSVTYAQIIDADNPVPEGENLVLSASMGVLPGMSLQGDVSWFNDATTTGDDGVTGVVRLRVAF